MKVYKKWQPRYPIFEIYSEDDPKTPIGFEFAVEDFTNIPKSKLPLNLAKAKAIVVNYNGKEFIRIILRGLHNIMPELCSKDFIIPTKEA
jgi:hypothetical protein